jgi:hypothetical protein
MKPSAQSANFNDFVLNLSDYLHWNKILSKLLAQS